MAKRSKKTVSRMRGERRVPRVKKRDAGTSGISDALTKKVVPLTIGLVLIACLAIVLFATYDSVTASGFFVLRAVEVEGTDRASASDIEKIVRANAEKTGVWNADLMEIKQKIEKVTFVKTAAVTRDLPNGISVQISERVPVAIVRLSGKDHLVDGEGEMLAPVEKEEKQIPFTLLGWSQEKSEKASRENLERLKMYQKMIAEWRDYDLASRVRSVDLADLREPRATLEDSGLPVTIMLGRENFGQQLSNGIKAIVGKGNMFEGVNLVGQNMVLVPRKQR